MRERNIEASIERGKPAPPYVPFSTFRNFLDKISKRLPSGIDDSVMPLTSRVIRLQLAAALRYMGLVGPGDSPTEKLKRLAKSHGPERKVALREIIAGAYPFLFEGFDLESSTSSQLEQKFTEQGASGDTVRKCVAFFVAACREAGLEVSPYIKPFMGARSGTQRPERARGPAAGETATGHDSQGTPADGHIAPSWMDSLVDKFPSFNPKWPDEVKSKWFDGFQTLIRLLEYNKTPQ